MLKKTALTPASIEALQQGSLGDLLTPGLTIEVLGSGKKRWLYRRVVARKKIVAVVFGRLFPLYTIADAREWARGLNEKAEAGIDPRVAIREEKVRAGMTVDRAHQLYMVAVRDGRSSRAKRRNKTRTMEDKLGIYRRDIAPKIGQLSVYAVTEADLVRLVDAKGKVSKVRANRLAAELKVFFGWAASRGGPQVRSGCWRRFTASPPLARRW